MNDSTIRSSSHVQRRRLNYGEKNSEKLNSLSTVLFGTRDDDVPYQWTTYERKRKLKHQSEREFFQADSVSPPNVPAATRANYFSAAIFIHMKGQKEKEINKIVDAEYDTVLHVTRTILYVYTVGIILTSYVCTIQIW